ncbi:LysR family transcriptional regulator [Duganella sp. BJB488]|uniref:LysR family transcriptional regulator n=1 Tax=unclassified Duganella TaxID=2636909 RepID=UPI000E351266|nr:MULTISPECIES: LysR family transcriptional regulator [unclassified Duganella]NVD70056.1 LysR family transcriptional regulator [Duganella sp. BJB1802]RFP23035.1 LysR family transcriptional regulator [Duganella sp. BJB489]RFP24888.1 LysR family transcriptional regulator [Duganella sp. BJB488]RFP34035.1 LysR family transcriptional regulator [Duganella sp. BJB480]
MHISKVDLNLFIVFEAIYAEGSITRASLKMNLTQPAISHALNRLRVLFEDPLFERQGHVMVPTPLSRSIIDSVRQSLRGFEVTLNGAGHFDAATSERTFSLALRDVLEASVLPPLMARVAQDAPTVGLNTLQVGRRELESELAAGSLDAAIDILLPLSNDIRRTLLATDSTVVLVRRDHPLVSGALDLDGYLKLEHIQTSSRRRGPGLEDFELSRMGLQRRVRLRCQHYFAACRAVSQTDLALTMPERLARVVNQQFGNQILPFPLQMPSLDIYLYWHANIDHDPAGVWLREQIKQAMLAAD